MLRWKIEFESPLNSSKWNFEAVNGNNSKHECLFPTVKALLEFYYNGESIKPATAREREWEREIVNVSGNWRVTSTPLV